MVQWEAATVFHTCAYHKGKASYQIRSELFSSAIRLNERCASAINGGFSVRLTPNKRPP